MGHERIGFLPKTKRWSEIVDQLSSFSPENDTVEKIAQKAIKNVRTRFKNIERDRGVIAAFKFLLLLAQASVEKNPARFIIESDIKLPDEVTPFQIAKAINKWVLDRKDSNEYAELAKSAAIDAVSEWYRVNRGHQKSLFETDEDPYNVWEKASSGSGFSELSRLYFSKFTEKYLKYFLEREASDSIQNLSSRIYFNKRLEEHIEVISKHAFDISKITQSFAAGWYNKNAIKRTPSDRQITGFLSLAFGKIRSELLREEKE